jgi:hypothetical protein
MMAPVSSPSPECFIAMPLTTPTEAVSEYGGDPDHFLHVLDHLLVPAVEKAGYRPIRPIMTGADLIQAEIIRNLEAADLVLCDISRHNPNVFFELGVRTSLDRPIALIRDNRTDRLPFDTGILNTHMYDASLAPWRLNQEIQSLAKHISLSAENAQGTNPLWKYFGLTKRADPDTIASDPVQGKLDALVASIEALQRDMRNSGRQPREAMLSSELPPRSSIDRLLQAADKLGVGVEAWSFEGDGVVNIAAGTYTKEAERALGDLAKQLGLRVSLQYVLPKS